MLSRHLDHNEYGRHEYCRQRRPLTRYTAALRESGQLSLDVSLMIWAPPAWDRSLLVVSAHNTTLHDRDMITLADSRSEGFIREL